MMVTRRRLLQQTALGMTGASLGLFGDAYAMASPAAGGERRPNIVFILSDDLGYGDLGCYGHPHIHTPYLDTLALEGVRFTDCYAAAPVCSPSRAGSMTGRNPYRCEIPDWIPPHSSIHLQPQEISIASLLRSAGYKTAHCGKWHLNGIMDGSQPTPGDHGFELWKSTQNNAGPSHLNPQNFFHNGIPMGERTGYSSTLIVDDAIQFIQESGDRPFAAFVWFHAPHEPIATAKEFTSLYTHLVEENQAIYFGNVSQMDYEVGRLMQFLDTSGLRDRTVVVFTSDNGPETLNRYRGAERSYGSSNPFRGMKLHLFEGGIRVPGIIRWPNHVRAGTICSEPVNGTDFFTTFCDLAGIAPPTDRVLDGVSLIPVFEGKTLDRPQPLYWRYDRAISWAKLALRQGDWKILSNLELDSFALYNLKEDKTEQNNLALTEPEILKRLTEALRSIHESIENDPISVKIG